MLQNKLYLLHQYNFRYTHTLNTKCPGGLTPGHLFRGEAVCKTAKSRGVSVTPKVEF